RSEVEGRRYGAAREPRHGHDRSEHRTRTAPGRGRRTGRSDRLGREGTRRRRAASGQGQLRLRRRLPTDVPGTGELSAMTEAVIIDAIRTPIGKRKGKLSGWHPTDLLGHVLRAGVERNGIDPEQVDDVIGG